MPTPVDLDTFRAALADAVAAGDIASAVATIHPAGRVLASEHGEAFRELIAGLPVEIWHNDPQIAAQLGSSFRANGSPRGKSALGYFRAAEDALALTPEAPAHCLASVLLGHGAALRTLGELDNARTTVLAARDIISEQLADVPFIRIELGARFSLENGMLDLEEGLFDSARGHLEYAHGLARGHLTRAEHIELLGALALLDALSGELDRSVLQVGYAKELAEGSDLMGSGFGAPALLAEVMVANERYELDAAIALEPAMFEAACRTEWEPYAHAVSAQLLALQGQFIEAIDRVERSLQGYDGWERTGYGADFARLLRAALLLALDQAESSWNVLQTLEPGEHHTLCPARMIAQLRMIHGDLLGADEAIRDCEDLGGLHCARTVVDIQLIRASIELARGNKQASDNSADRAFVTMARTGSRAGLQRIPSSTLALLARNGVEHPQSPAVTAMLTVIVERTAGQESRIEPLSARERLVLAQVQRGLTVAAIAAELYISPNTVKTHLRRLYRKLDVSTRDEAIRAARSLGLDREITRDSPAPTSDSEESAVL
ncbi:MAG: LuxR C-terminal-related transcriptional regulator [Actinomycetota bacterium]|nr:LuxR C-terminal-related transcriptional regulator [Actinomycetota bacterium]